ncbi:MAG: hypothetical protein CMK09_18965 [Ponticaulis sp.]|nr:hypothetical protein [Ponticaulis sp.]|tara:strand:- start:163099 stop:165033 length:1935 start_codon:yes stop_codon:yes gene_type:complete
MPNWSIQARVRLLASLAIVAMITLTLIFVISGQIERSLQARQSELSESAVTSQTALAHLSHMKLAALEFLEQRDLALAERFQNDADRFHAPMSELKRTDAAIEPGQIDQDAQAFIDVTQSVFELRQRLGLDQDSGLEGRLRDAVHNVESRLEGFENETLTVKMLMMRRHEKDFMMRVDQKYVDRLSARVSEFKTLLPGYGYSDADQAELMRLISSYESDFKTWASLRLELQESQDLMLERYDHVAEELNGYIDALVYEATLFSQYQIDTNQRALIIAAFATLILALVCGVLAWLLGNSISRPIRNIAESMYALSSGQSGRRKTGRNEIEDMQDALSVFRQTQMEAERLRDEAAARESRQREERQRDRENFLNELEEKLGGLIVAIVNTSGELAQTSAMLKTEADASFVEAETAQKSSERTAESTKIVSSATEELSQSIASILTQLQSSSEMGEKAVRDTSELDETVRTLSRAADEVLDVLSIISDIANQTNLLSLNATIEASRAGEAGKGFAVVAGEVKQLANQVAKSTHTISARIDAIRSGVDAASQSIAGVSKTIDGMSRVSSEIVRSMDQQKSASQNISEGVSAAARDTQSVTTAVSNLSQSVQRTDESVNAVNSAANSLSERAEALRADTQEFLRKMRAA